MTLPFPLILASGSPRRRELLSAAGCDFKAVRPPLDEPRVPPGAAHCPAAWAEALAYFKARAVADQFPDALIIGADTLVVHANTVIGKPTDQADARRILSTNFAGHNEIITGLALLYPSRNKRIITHVSTIVTMRRMQPDELEEYLASGAWRDKAGAYAFQEGGDKFVRSLQGSRTNIVGLPMEKLKQLLTEFN